MKELRDVVKEIKTISNQEHLRLHGNEIMDFAVRIYNTQKIDKFKKEVERDDTRPTEEQIKLARKLKIDYLNMNKKQLSEEISKKFAEKDKQKNIKNPDY